jgi:hypothetical protein
MCPTELFTISPDITVVETELNKVTELQPPPATNTATTNKKRKRRKVATPKGPGADGLAGMGSGSDSDSDASDHEHEKPIYFPPVPCNTVCSPLCPISLEVLGSNTRKWAYAWGHRVQDM